MKKTILIALFFIIFIFDLSYAEEVRVYNDYNPVRILYLVSGKDADVEASKAGLSGSFKEMDSSELPNDRTYRDFWKLEKGIIVVDENLKSTHNSKEEKKLGLLKKLKVMGLDEEEINLILRRD